MSHHRLGTSWASPVGLLIAFLNLGTGGCPVQTTCGVYDRRQEHPQETDAQSYTCRATFQLADGETITSPEAARLDLLARKESLSIRLADLRAELDRLEEGSVVYRGLPPPSEQAATQQIERIKREIERMETAGGAIDRQVQKLESISHPAESLVLRNGTWTVEEGRVTVRAQGASPANRPVVIPYVIRSQDGDILETGNFVTESVQVESVP
jgi:hypothetical protein